MEPFIVEIDDDLEDIVPGFLENRKNDVLELQNFYEKREFKEIERIGHKVSGSSGGYGFHQLGKIAKEIELSAGEENEEKVRKLITDFIDYVDNVEVKFIKVD